MTRLSPRYRYLLRTAPPEALEQAHTEAFSQLTPEQRAEVLRQLSAELPASERAAAGQQADSQGLARMATRAELRQPGFLERTFGSRGFAPGGVGAAAGGMGIGGMVAGSMLGSIAGTFIGSAIANQFLGGFGHSPEAANLGEAQGLADSANHENKADDEQGSGDDAYAAEDNSAADDFSGDDDFARGDDFDV